MSATLRGSSRPVVAPAVVRPGRGTSARSKVRVQWLVLGAALVVLAGTIVAWALARAADRVQVVTVAKPVQAGDVIDADDLTVGEIAVDPTITGLVPFASLARLAGRVATIDLEPGMLVTSGMWAEDGGIAVGERTVGAVLAPGRHPAGLAHGSLALALDVRTSSSASSATAPAEVDGTTPESTPSSASTGSTPAATPVRVIDAELDESGDLRVTLAVPEADAVRIAALAATDSLAVIGVPAPDARSVDPVPSTTNPTSTAPTVTEVGA